MEIIERVFDLLKQKGLPAKDLAKYIGVNPSVLSTWKSRGTPPPTEYIIRICEFFEVSPEYLLTGHKSDAAVPANLTDGRKRMAQATEHMSESDRLILAGALMQHLRATGTMNITKFLYPDPHSQKQAATEQVFAPALVSQK